MSSFVSRHSRPLAVLAAAAALAGGSAVGVQAATSATDAPSVPAPPEQPTRADQIQNIDQVKTAIKAYYGDTVSGTNPDGSVRHVPSASGAYARELRGLTRRASAYLTSHRTHARADKLAIVLDVDDTSLNTYNYEIASNFVYDPVKNGEYVDAAAFPRVFRMPALAKKAVAQGYTLFFLTGRPESQRAGTEVNLAKVGFPAVASSQVYLKDESQPYITCDTTYTRFDTDRSTAPSCSTVERKTQTRAHIHALGYRIVGNFGDQFSDLTGGYAKRTFKLPNPMYFLP